MEESAGVLVSSELSFKKGWMERKSVEIVCVKVISGAVGPDDVTSPQ